MPASPSAITAVKKVAPPREKKGQSRKFLDLFFYSRLGSNINSDGQIYVADKAPTFDSRKGLQCDDSNGFEHDICDMGLAAFGLGAKDVKEPFGTVIKIKVLITSIEKGGFAAEVKPIEYAKPEKLLGPPLNIRRRKGIVRDEDEDDDDN